MYLELSGGNTRGTHKKNMVCKKEATRKWDKRQKKIEAKVKAYNLENQEVTFDYDEFGNITRAYIDGEYDADLTRTIQDAIRNRRWDMLEGLGSGFLEQWAMNNGKGALDALFGKRTVNLNKAGTSSYATGQFVGDLFSMVQGGAEFLGGGLWAFGGTAAAIAAAPGSGGSSVAAIPAVNAGGVALAGHGSGVFLNAWNSFRNGYPTNNGQQINPGKGESPVWKDLDNVKGMDRKTSGKGNKKKYYEWDHTHNDIEVYNKTGVHLGSMDPTTGKMYKPPVKGRTIDIN